jgi:hypothetical protein
LISKIQKTDMEKMNFKDGSELLKVWKTLRIFCLWFIREMALRKGLKKVLMRRVFLFWEGRGWEKANQNSVILFCNYLLLGYSFSVVH